MPGLLQNHAAHPVSKQRVRKNNAKDVAGIATHLWCVAIASH
jgi:hypothetical protein